MTLDDAKLRDLLSGEWSKEWPSSTGIYDMKAAEENYYADVPIKFILAFGRAVRDAAYEEAAEFHDREAANNAQEHDYAAMHQVSARAIRALIPPEDGGAGHFVALKEEQ
jgi:hypothetical protein